MTLFEGNFCWWRDNKFLFSNICSLDYCSLYACDVIHYCYAFSKIANQMSMGTFCWSNFLYHIYSLLSIYWVVTWFSLEKQRNVLFWLKLLCKLIVYRSLFRSLHHKFFNLMWMFLRCISATASIKIICRMLCNFLDEYEWVEMEKIWFLNFENVF